jgi:HNH endonuclease
MLRKAAAVRARNRERPLRRRSELERLLDRTVLEPTHPELGTCWQFTGTATPYGRIAKAQDSYTHRLGWKLLRGPIPEGNELHHRCGVYTCWNPDHLEPVTHAENLALNRKTVCKHGHQLAGENLRIDPRTGSRACRACLRENQRRLRPEARRDRTEKSDVILITGQTNRHAGRRPAILERLLDRTVLGQPDPELGACWLFTGPTDPYGRIGKGPERLTHRLGWKLLRGPIPDGMELHHRCGVPACWNPDHLKVVTHTENMAAGRNATKTHCIRGHPLSDHNLRVGPKGQRSCRACNAENQRAFRDRHASVKQAT